VSNFFSNRYFDRRNGAPKLNQFHFLPLVAVGSFDNLAKPSEYIKVDDMPFPLSFAAANASFPLGDNTWDYVITDPDAEASQSNTDGCGGPFKNSPAGKVAIIRFGVRGSPGYCGSVGRCTAAASAGAIACIIYAPDDEPLGIAGAESIPSASITHDAGLAIVAAYNKSGKPAKITFNPSQQQMFPMATGGTVSDFSSPGLDPELWIKPDIGGVGGEVLSTLSPVASKGKPYYGLLSGTSMSSPYVAGTIALLIEANRKIQFPEVKSRLVNNAQPGKIYQSNLTDSVAKQGGGLVNIYNAITSKTVVYPSSLSLNDTTRTLQHYTLKISNSYTVPVTYTLSHQPAAQMNPFNEGDQIMQQKATLQYTPDYAIVTFRNKPTRSFKVKPGETIEARVDIDPPKNSRKDLYPVYSGYVTLTNDHDDTILRVPYAGVAGDWDEAPIFVKNSPSLFDAMLSNELYHIAGFNENATSISAGVYLLDNQWTHFPSPQAFNPRPTRELNPMDGALVFLPFATTTRGFRVEVEYVGYNSTIKRQIRELGGSDKNDGKAYLVLDVLEIRKREATPGSSDDEPFSLVPVGALQAANVQRSAPEEGQSMLNPSMYIWTGKVYANEKSEEAVDLPFGGEYQIKLSGMKHFKKVGGKDTQYEVIKSGVFRWVPGTPVSSGPEGGERRMVHN
jgi:hypothetical protein